MLNVEDDLGGWGYLPAVELIKDILLESPRHSEPDTHGLTERQKLRFDSVLSMICAAMGNPAADISMTVNAETALLEVDELLDAITNEEREHSHDTKTT